MCCSRCTSSRCRTCCRSRRSVEYRIPRYDMDAFLIEAELLLDWYLPRCGVDGADERARDVPRALARRAAAGDRCAADLGAARLPFAQPALAAGARRASQRLGLLDFQDAADGARRPTISPRCCRMPASTCRRRLEIALLGRYVRRRRDADPQFRRAALHQALRHAGGAARQQDPRHLRAPRPARRQAAIFASHAARMGAICSARSRIRRWRR